MSTEQQIKAKETYYNGYRFRSRSEARWAVFFDHAKIKYFYEPEGFPVKGTSGYLPDFYLPDSKEFFEVKGILDDDDYKKITTFMEETNYPVVVGYSDMTFQAPEPDFCTLADKDWSYLFRCVDCGKLFFRGIEGCWRCTACGEWDEHHEEVVTGDDPFTPSNGGFGDCDKQQELIRAFKAARQARFEHGEKPEQVRTSFTEETTKIEESIQPKPQLVPVRYNKTRYKNVIDACWAVFFDTTKISYEYFGNQIPLEYIPTSYTGSQQYMPKFYLPEFNIWFDVYLNKDDVNLQNIKKFYTAIKDYRTLFLAFGCPEKAHGRPYRFKGEPSQGSCWAVKVSCYSTQIKESYDSLILGKEKPSFLQETVWKPKGINIRRVETAIKEARSAKFELVEEKE